jgi:hypothetical protein
MKIKLTRTSVCAADDVDAPHAKAMTVPDDIPLDELARIVQKDYIPMNIAGGKATWSLVATEPLAVLAQQWRDPKLVWQFHLDLAALKGEDGSVRLHVNYHVQVDPDIVLEVLRELRFGGNLIAESI